MPRSPAPEGLSAFADQAVIDGLVDGQQAAALKEAARAAAEAAHPFSPEEEYYLGRAVAAEIFSAYRPYGRADINAYIDRLGQGLALFSPRPEIFAGYHFMVMDSEEINAIASPGGHILVTRGLLRKTKSEDELAALLCHEIVHVALGHGLASMQGARLAQVIFDYALRAGKAGGGEAAVFAESFGEAISELASVLIVSGYSQASEFRADAEAKRMLAAAGYDPEALARLIERLPATEDAGGVSFVTMHPAASSRLEALREIPLPPVQIANVSAAERGARFNAMRKLF